ncbi:hypothetical protein COCNU_13G007740 [Cocos nucifera]|uniref:Uncharacterized protein n=1 Tax=Cocos nucifera TaxID=13894 RepID=A0A8K0IV37_COCNU|nr:hypothetical protein COCNU_13G007740 [Cocos nucifera]
MVMVVSSSLTAHASTPILALLVGAPTGPTKAIPGSTDPQTIVIVYIGELKRKARVDKTHIEERKRLTDECKRPSKVIKKVTWDAATKVSKYNRRFHWAQEWIVALESSIAAEKARNLIRMAFPELDLSNLFDGGIISLAPLRASYRMVIRKVDSDGIEN